MSKYFRIDHIYRHLKAIAVEREKPFPRRKIIEREVQQILIRLTQQVEELMKNDAIEQGYVELAKDPEIKRPNRKKAEHHCGFDFKYGVKTAKCKCGAVATNPYWTLR